MFSLVTAHTRINVSLGGDDFALPALKHRRNVGYSFQDRGLFHAPERIGGKSAVDEGIDLGQFGRIIS